MKDLIGMECFVVRRDGGSGGAVVEKVCMPMLLLAGWWPRPKWTHVDTIRTIEPVRPARQREGFWAKVWRR